MKRILVVVGGYDLFSSEIWLELDHTGYAVVSVMVKDFLAGEVILSGYDLVVMSSTYREKDDGALFAIDLLKQGQPVLLVGHHDEIPSASPDKPDFEEKVVQMIEQLLEEENAS